MQSFRRLTATATAIAIAIAAAPLPATILATTAAPSEPRSPMTLEHTTDEPAAVLPSPDPRIDVIDAGPDQRTLVGEALDRFAAAGLALPDLELRFYDDTDACRGHDGLFMRRSSPWQVRVCSELDYVVYHELAHAWEAAHLDDEARASYLSYRGLATWNDPDAEWRDRGIEDAAFVVQQNVMLTPTDPAAPAWAERIAAYEELTGLTSPATGEHHAHS